MADTIKHFQIPIKLYITDVFEIAEYENIMKTRILKWWIQYSECVKKYIQILINVCIVFKIAKLINRFSL